MPTTIDNETSCEDLQDIISAVPSWIVRWGITLALSVLLEIVILSALIKYPDVVSTQMIISSVNAPKVVLARQSGKLTTLLVKEGEMVEPGQHMAFFETTASPDDVLTLNRELKVIQADINANRNPSLVLSSALNLGEIQESFQQFYQEFLQYRSTTSNGYYLNKLVFLNNELQDIQSLKKQLEEQRALRIREYDNNKEEYQSYQKLYRNKVISKSEFRMQENKFLASKYPVQQSQTELLNNSSSYSAKERELFEVRHTIMEQQSRFLQSVNQCLSETQKWILTYILIAPIKGRVTFAGIVQPNQNIIAGQEVFVINTGSKAFFGDLKIPQYNMGKIKTGENVLVKMESYPYEQYGIITGKLTYISDVAYRDSVFTARVTFDNPGKKIIIKNGMRGQVDIITEDSSLLKRFFRGITKMLNNAV